MPHHSARAPGAANRRIPRAIGARVPAVVGQCAHAAEHAFRRTADEPDLTVALDPEGRAFALRLGLLHGLQRQLGLATQRARLTLRGQRAQQALGIARGADRCAEVHHRLGEVAGALGRGDRIGGLADRLARARQRFIDREQPGDDALDVGIDHHRAPPEGNRGDGGGCVGAEAGELAQLRLGVGKRAALSHGARAGDEIARARVVAEACPLGHDVGLGRCGERRDGRPALGEAGEVGRGVGGSGLLEHDLGKPHAVGIGRRFAWPRPPRQGPAMTVIPVEQRPRDPILHRPAMAWPRARWNATPSRRTPRPKRS